MRINKQFKGSGQYRQGDVMVIPSRIPENAVKLQPSEGNRVVLAEGEVTGHFHTMPYGPAVMFRDSCAGGRCYIETTEPTPLKHDEHNTITIEPGEKCVVRQRQYNGEARRVED